MFSDEFRLFFALIVAAFGDGSRSRNGAPDNGRHGLVGYILASLGVALMVVAYFTDL